MAIRNYKENIEGYDFDRVTNAPISKNELELLKKTVMMTEEDKIYLRKAGEALSKQVDQILDLWYSWVGSNEHLIYYFADKKTKEPIKEYLSRVRERFGQWILDTCFRDYDQKWLNYTYEIGLRHHKKKKNKTDRVNSVDIIPLRWLICFIYPITATIKPFLEKGGLKGEELEKAYNSWFKSVVLQVVIWAHPYSKDW
jgi:hypothetical protein